MSNDKLDYDALIVGAGFAGMYMLHRLNNLGMKAVVLEKASGVGGTWYWNRYPGARCDIESMQYSYSFSQELEQEWEWSERYASQEEILRYAEHVADRFNLRSDICLNTKVDALEYHTDNNIWQATINAKEDSSKPITTHITVRFCIMATGCLSTPNTPTFPGLEQFQGNTYHTGKWPHQTIDFSGQDVAIIGTGSSGIQSLPVVAEQANRVTVFQRTPNYIIPSRNRPFEAGEQNKTKSQYAQLRAKAKLARNGVAQDITTDRAKDAYPKARFNRYERRWQDGGLTFIGSYADLLLDKESNQTAAEFIRQKIRETVKDPNVADLLSPQSTIGCKRLCVDSHYFAAFNRENVTLVDVSESNIECISSAGPVVEDKTYTVDAIILATGFDAITGTLNRIDIRGKNEISLKETWQEGPASYMGLMASDFPNLFTITGPASPSVLSNVLTSIEYHVEWISNCLEYMSNQSLTYIEASESAQTEWMKDLNKVVDKTLYRTCHSWYLGENILGKPKTFMPYPGVPTYEQICTKIAHDNYPGFNFQTK